MSATPKTVITITPIEVCHACLERADGKCEACEKSTCARHFASNIDPLDPHHCATCRDRLNDEGGCYL